MASSISDPAGWTLWTFSARSKLLRRISLHLVVISKTKCPADCDGHWL